MSSRLPRLYKSLLTVAVIVAVALMEKYGIIKTSALPPAKQAAEASQTDPVVVSRVIDGDTFEFNAAGSRQRVRLIGVNTPETVASNRPVECFGKEASAYAIRRLEGATVRLETDSTQGDKDKYGRLLRYVWLENGELFNKSVIADGYAYEYTYDLPYRYQSEFKTAQAEARSSGKGLWADGACGLKNNQ